MWIHSEGFGSGYAYATANIARNSLQRGLPNGAQPRSQRQRENVGVLVTSLISDMICQRRMARHLRATLMLD